MTRRPPGCWRGRSAPPGRPATKRRSTALRAEALKKDPHLVDGLVRAASDADDDAREEALALLEAAAPGTQVPRRLPVITG